MQRLVLKSLNIYSIILVIKGEKVWKTRRKNGLKKATSRLTVKILLYETSSHSYKTDAYFVEILLKEVVVEQKKQGVISSCSFITAIKG